MAIENPRMRDRHKVWDMRTIYELFGLRYGAPIPPDMADVRNHHGLRVRLLRQDDDERARHKCRRCGVGIVRTNEVGVWSHTGPHGEEAEQDHFAEGPPLRCGGAWCREPVERTESGVWVHTKGDDDNGQHVARPYWPMRTFRSAKPRIVVDCGCGKTIAFGRMVQHASSCDFARATGVEPMENPARRQKARRHDTPRARSGRSGRATPRRNPSPDYEIAKRIIEGSARAVYVQGWTERLEDLQIYPSGELTKQAPPTSPAAREWAIELWRQIVDDNPQSLSGGNMYEAIEEIWGEVVERERQTYVFWVIEDDGRYWNERAGQYVKDIDKATTFSTKEKERIRREYAGGKSDTGIWPGRWVCVGDTHAPSYDKLFENEDWQHTFGHYIAMQSIGAGVAWSDDYADHELNLPRLESDPWGIVPASDLLARPRAGVNQPGVNSDLLVGEIANADEVFGTGVEYEDGSTAARAYAFTAVENEYERGNEQDMSHVVPVMHALNRLVAHLNYAASYQDEGLERARDLASVLYDGRRELQQRRYMAVNYQTTTPESAAEGTYAALGFDEGIDLEPDEDDEEEGITAVDKAVKILKDRGAYAPSSSHFHQGVWYSEVDGHTNFRTGEETTHTFHLYSFTKEEEREVFERVVGKSRR